MLPHRAEIIDIELPKVDGDLARMARCRSVG